jgi:enoyl-CoA hydratase
MTPAVLKEAQDGILLVTLNRPAVRNAIDEEMSLGVASAFEQLDSSADLRVAVVTGADGTFCAGMDMRAFVDKPPEESAAALARLVQHRTSKPIIAAIDGAAVGGGLEFALACDLLVATPNAKLGIPEVVRSMVPSGGALLRLPQRLPYGTALDMALTGDPITGERAYQLGLVSRLADQDDVVTLALHVAKKISQAGPLAVAGSKQVIERRIANAVGDQEWQAQLAVTTEVNSSEDAREGVLAFLEKRPPMFRGHVSRPGAPTSGVVLEDS